MEYKLFITQSFANDLDSALEYISLKLVNPTAAGKLLDLVQRDISDICDNPYMHPKYHNETLAENGYRFSVVKNYLIFYKVNEADKIITVMRFLYGGQNVIEILR